MGRLITGTSVGLYGNSVCLNTCFTLNGPTPDFTPVPLCNSDNISCIPFWCSVSSCVLMQLCAVYAYYTYACMCVHSINLASALFFEHYPHCPLKSDLFLNSKHANPSQPSWLACPGDPGVILVLGPEFSSQFALGIPRFSVVGDLNSGHHGFAPTALFIRTSLPHHTAYIRMGFSRQGFSVALVHCTYCI